MKEYRCIDKEYRCGDKVVFEISDNLLKDLAKIGSGFRVINTPKEEYPTLVRASFDMVIEAYEKAGLPVDPEVVNAAIEFYCVGEDQPPIS